ncbi:MAG: ABC transporter ATP-binding protein [Microvirga sp.]
MTGPPLLQIEQLKTYFSTRIGDVRAVDGVDLTINRGETVGLVGESGSGKSVTARSIMRLVPTPPGRYAGGRILFQGTDILKLANDEMEDLRGGRISMIFQDPMTFLNPVYTAGDQVAEAIRRHQSASKRAAREQVIELFRTVGIPNADQRYGAYPHQLSGGMRQRVMIAIALSSRPALLVADEPTTALDVTIQAQILKLMLELKERTGAAVILITHDLGVVAETCQRVIVMYAGRKIEEAPILELFDRPAHPYTRGLMASIPRYGGGRARKRRLAEIPGIVPSLREPIEGCAFAPRCPYAAERCRVEAPPLRQVGGGHVAACHFAEEVMAEGVLAAASPGGRGRVGDSRPGEGLRSLG